VGDKIEKNEMGVAYSAYGARRGVYRGDHGVVERIKLKCILRKWVWGYGLGRAGSG
jgi:hypothetical protein